LNHWDGLTRFLDDGRIELDSNIVSGLAQPCCALRGLEKSQ
jgi:transposase